LNPKNLMFVTSDPTEPSNDDITSYILNKKQLLAYEMEELYSSLKTKKFKSIFLNFIPEIQKQDITIQIFFCKEIITKIQQKYHFMFPENLSINSFGEVNDVLDFVKFIEFDNLDFLEKLFLYLNIKPIYLNISYKKDIISFVDNFFYLFNNKIIRSFLQSTPSDIFFEIIKIMSLKNISELTNNLLIKEQMIWIIICSKKEK